MPDQPVSSEARECPTCRRRVTASMRFHMDPATNEPCMRELVAYALRERTGGPPAIEASDYAASLVYADDVMASLHANGLVIATPAGPEERGEGLREAANDVRANHQPNEWDSCVVCRKDWPCDAELLAELVIGPDDPDISEEYDFSKAQRGVYAERAKRGIRFEAATPALDTGAPPNIAVSGVVNPGQEVHHDEHEAPTDAPTALSPDRAGRVRGRLPVPELRPETSRDALGLVAAPSVADRTAEPPLGPEERGEERLRAALDADALTQAMYSRLPYSNWTYDAATHVARVIAEYERLIALHDSASSGTREEGT